MTTCFAKVPGTEVSLSARIPQLGCLILLGLAVTACPAQISGNGAYGGGGGKGRAEQLERSQRVISKEDLPPTGTSMFVDANVLMNVKADEYVAVFGIARTGTTVQEASEKMDGTVKQFTTALKALRIREADVYVDFIAQPKIYSFEIEDRTAKEKLSGFELKKNISIRYTSRDLIDKLVDLATDAKIYDLIKVDYVVRDINAVQNSLMAEAAAIIKQKTARYEKLLSIKVAPPAQVYAERPAIYYPNELYEAYTATESETVNRPRNLDSFTVQTARKGRTFYFNGLDASHFDKVINPVIVGPVVQFTLYLKLKYEVQH